MHLELVTASKRIASPFEEAYQWLRQRQNHLDPRETIGTIAFSSKGEVKLNHLTWSDVTELHLAYERIKNIEVLLRSRDVEKVFRGSCPQQ